MLTSTSLLALAEDFASRIPGEDRYSADRNASWLAIAKSWLTQNNFASAKAACDHLDDTSSQADFRAEAGIWAGSHPECEDSVNLLRDTVEHIDLWESHFTRRGASDLVAPACALLGAGPVHLMSSKLQDSFTATWVLVELSLRLPDLGARRETLRWAEELAKTTSPGNRDYALRVVINGYHQAGLMDDEKRARSLMSQDLEGMNENEERILGDATRAIDLAGDILRPFSPQEPDTPLKRFRRFLDYDRNDLKVIFLAQAADAGDLNDPDVEQLLGSDAFLRIAPPSPPSIYCDPSQLDVANLAKLLFQRPVCQDYADFSLIAGDGERGISDSAQFLQTVTELFRQFGQVTEQFTPAQVDQGLWYLFGEPFWLISLVDLSSIPVSVFVELIRAMFFPFQDYFLPRADSYYGTAFYMWWDNFSPSDQHPEMEAAARDVLRQIQMLPSPKCREAAEHGFEHVSSD